MKKLIPVMLSMILSIVAMAETKTAVFTVNPQMSCSNCENKIKSNLRFEKGIVDVVPSAEKQTVVVNYDDNKTNVEKIVKGFKKIGYTATEVSAEAKKAESGCSCCKSDQKQQNDGCCKTAEKEQKSGCCK